MLVDQTKLPPAPVTDEMSDRELLQRFEEANDEAAFAAVIRRHGSMVLRVGQRVLERREDAEDVFQATFLVLAKKAGSVSWRESIGTWLHEAARRLAREVRRKKRRQEARESRREIQHGNDSLEEVSSRELLTILDDEMASLPEELRAPLLLCCLQGMSGDEAANQLGCSPSTVKRRLRQGRELLQAKLARRGIALSVAALATFLALGTAVAKVPPGLVTATARAATQFAAGVPVASGLVSATSLVLSRHLLPVFGIKLKLLVGAVVLGGLIAGSVAYRGFAPAPGVWRQGHPETAAVDAPGEGREVLLNAKPGKAVPTVPVMVETTLRTKEPFIRQWAFDHNPLSFFASANNPTDKDHFTIVFDKPVAVKAISVVTGTPNDTWLLTHGQLEVSVDGIEFEPLARFTRGTASGNAKGRELLAVRVQPGTLDHPLLIREFTIESDVPVAGFRHPVEFVVDASDAPEMAGWAKNVARTCERAYPMICEELAADGFRPPMHVSLVVRRDASALVYASGSKIVVSAGYFEANPFDVGAVIHATSCVVQAYHGRNTPGWLVQGIADYIRFFKFEPGALESPDPVTARYDADSRETAAFLAYLVEKYDASLVRKLNEALRNGRYNDDIWVTLTGKSLRELGDEWHRSLRR